MSYRPKERVAREALRKVYRWGVRGGGGDDNDADMLLGSEDGEYVNEEATKLLEALRSGREEPLTGGEEPHPLVHEVRMIMYEASQGWLWPDEEDIAEIIRFVRTPSTETDAPGEAERRGPRVEEDLAQVFNNAKHGFMTLLGGTGEPHEIADELVEHLWEMVEVHTPYQRPDPDEGSGEGEEWPGASAFERGYQAGRRDEAYFRSRPEPTVEGEGEESWEMLRQHTLNDRLEVLAFRAGLAGDELLHDTMREAAARLRERPEGQRIAGSARKKGENSWTVVRNLRPPFYNFRRCTLIIHEPTREEG